MSKNIVEKKKEKGNKGVSAVVLNETKPKKVHGPVPDSYKPKQKSAIEAPQTDPMILWNGWSGIVEIQGMRFRSSKNNLANGKCGSPQISVISAPSGTDLYGLAGSSIYVTVLRLRSMTTFRSNFAEGSVDYKRQERLWSFLNKIFLDLGLKQSPAHHQRAKRAVVSNKENTKVSNSVDDFASGVLGVYSFEKNGEPSACFKVKMMEYTNYKTLEKKQALIVEAMSINPGHELYDYVRTTPMKPFVFHDQLSWTRPPNFKGGYAGDSEKIWEFLTDTIAKHRKSILGEKTNNMAPNCKVRQDSQVIYLADRRVA